MRRPRHEPLHPAVPDEPFGPPPEEYHYRCSTCGEELWVNEAIMNAGIGMAKFQARRHHLGWV